MLLRVIRTTDNQFVGLEWDGTFPLSLDHDVQFTPDRPYVLVEPGVRRYFTSNYILDAQEI